MTDTREEILSLIHDLGSPLCALRGLIKEDSYDQELVNSAYKKVFRLTNKLKNHFVFDEADTRESLLDSIENVVDLKEVEYPKMVFSIQCEPVLRDLVCDFSKVDFERSLSNLLNNAVEAGASQVCLKVLNQRGKLLIKVVDNGNGLLAKDISLVQSSKKHSTKPAGSGIGLSNSIKFMNSIGGDLKILSTPYVGTNVIMSFPRNLFDSVDYGPHAG